MADQAAAVSHETFFATVLTESGKVRPVGEGQDGARRVSFPNGIEAVLKPKLFGTEGAFGIAPESQYRREAAAYQYDRQLLGWGIVPPATLTVYRGTPYSSMNRSLTIITVSADSTSLHCTCDVLKVAVATA